MFYQLEQAPHRSTAAEAHSSDQLAPDQVVLNAQEEPGPPRRRLGSGIGGIRLGAFQYAPRRSSWGLGCLRGSAGQHRARWSKKAVRQPDGAEKSIMITITITIKITIELWYFWLQACLLNHSGWLALHWLSNWRSDQTAPSGQTAQNGQTPGQWCTLVTCGGHNSAQQNSGFHWTALLKQRGLAAWSDPWERAKQLPGCWHGSLSIQPDLTPP